MILPTSRDLTCTVAIHIRLRNIVKAFKVYDLHGKRGWKEWEGVILSLRIRVWRIATIAIRVLMGLRIRRRIILGSISSTVLRVGILLKLGGMRRGKKEKSQMEERKEEGERNKI